MKKLLKIEFIVCAILLLCTNVIKAATVYTDGALQYTIMSDGNIEIVEYFGEDTEVKIPMAIGYHVVTSIKAGAFDESDVTKIMIPESVVYYEGAFPKTCNVDIYDAKGEITSRLQEASKADDVTPTNPDDDKPVNPPSKPDDNPVNPGPNNPTNPNEPGKKSDDNKKNDNPGNNSSDNTSTNVNENQNIVPVNNETNLEDEGIDISDVFGDEESNNVLVNDSNNKTNESEHLTEPSNTTTTLVGIDPIGYVIIGVIVLLGVGVFVFIKKRNKK